MKSSTSAWFSARKDSSALALLSRTRLRNLRLPLCGLIFHPEGDSYRNRPGNGNQDNLCLQSEELINCKYLNPQLQIAHNVAYLMGIIDFLILILTTRHNKWARLSSRQHVCSVTNRYASPVRHIASPGPRAKTQFTRPVVKSDARVQSYICATSLGICSSNKVLYWARAALEHTARPEN